MSQHFAWRRQGVGSGPSNVLNGRYEVRRLGTRWFVIDRRQPSLTLGLNTLPPSVFNQLAELSRSHRTLRLGHVVPWSSMAKARCAAEAYARSE